MAVMHRTDGKVWRLSIRAVLALALAWLSFAASAQTYPARTVRIIVGYTPGSPSDSVARVLAQNLGTTWGQPVVVENRPGAGGNIGSELVAKSEPDGYTLLLTASGPIVVNVSLFGKLPFDPIRDFAPVTMVYLTPTALYVQASLPVNSVSDLIAYIKSRPGKLNYSTTGEGTPLHLAAEMLKQRAGLDVVHIAYKGGPEMTAAVLSGEVTFNFNGLIAMPLVRAGKLKALGVATLQRSPLAPDVPTIAESGLPGFDVNAWGGLFVPARTPKEIVAKLHDDVVKGLADVGVRTRLTGLGVEPVGNSSEEFAKQIRSEIPRWAQVIKLAGIRIQ